MNKPVRRLCLTALLTSLSMLGGCCYPCAMLLAGLTSVNHTSQNPDQRLRLRIDTFLVQKGKDLELMPPGARCLAPSSVESYQTHRRWWPEIKGVIDEGTLVLINRHKFHNVGWLYWERRFARILTGPHAGKQVRLVGFGPKKVGSAYYEPNPDLLEFPPRPPPGSRP